MMTKLFDQGYPALIRLAGSHLSIYVETDAVDPAGYRRMARRLHDCTEMALQAALAVSYEDEEDGRIELAVAGCDVLAQLSTILFNVAESVERDAT